MLDVVTGIFAVISATWFVLGWTENPARRYLDFAPDRHQKNTMRIAKVLQGRRGVPVQLFVT
jgi:hypothetical protein